MPDGPVRPTERDPADDRALAEDTRLVRAVRWRLVAWSGGTTLVVLLLLGVALYLSAARSLEAAGLAQVEARAVEVDLVVRDPRSGPGPRYGFVFGGDGSGTYAMLLRGDGRRVDARGDELPPGLPNLSSIEAAAATGGTDVRLTTIDGTPLRILTREIAVPGGSVYVQVIGDRTAEQQTLDAILRVLVVGGAVVVLVAVGFGAFYARRALVPIRDSLVGQRAALRRQREFAADASHELRTPLTVIRSSVERLRRHRDEPVASIADALEDIDAEVGHLTTLVDDLLLLARSDSGALELARLTIDLGDVAADAAGALAQPAAARGVALVVDPEPAAVVGDPARLRRLVLILVDNAVRHTASGGGVQVRVRASGGGATLEVDDDGPGVRPEDMPRIFERFWRAPGGNGGGAGLGLAIARSIVDLHGGRIAVTNRQGGGARFSVRLPLAPGGAPAPVRPADGREAGAPG